MNTSALLNSYVNRFLAGYALPVLLLGFASCPAQASVIGPISGITIDKAGNGPEASECRAFAVTVADVETFMARAVLISSRQEHDFFDYGPCTATGTLRNRYGTWHWEMRNLGTGKLTASNGEVFLLADPELEAPLSGE